MFTHSLTAAAVASLVIASPAFAQSPTRTVAYGDINLRTEAGRQDLDRRLVRAAKSVCAVGQSRELTSQMNSARCYRGSIGDARTAAADAIAAKAGATVEVAAR